MEEQFTAWSVLVDAGLIGALLAVGTLARAVVKPLQTLMIPASVIAGILGLILGPQFLGVMPFSSQLGTYGSILIVIVFVCLALTDDFDVRKIGRPVGSFASYGVLIYASQVAIGALVALLVLQPLFDTPDSFAVLLFAGWAGGFGSAAAVGVAMLRIVDPTLKSGTMEQFGVAYIPVVPVEIAAVSFVPLLVIAGLSWAVVGIWGAIAVAAVVAAVLLVRTDPARRTPASA